MADPDGKSNDILQVATQSEDVRRTRDRQGITTDTGQTPTWFPHEPSSQTLSAVHGHQSPDRRSKLVSAFTTVLGRHGHAWIVHANITWIEHRYTRFCGLADDASGKSAVSEWKSIDIDKRWQG
jgi:hypothetical protein